MKEKRPASTRGPHEDGEEVVDDEERDGARDHRGDGGFADAFGTSHQVTLKKRVMGTLMGLASGAFRKQPKRILLPTGEALNSDEALFDLLPDTELTVELN